MINLARGSYSGARSCYQPMVLVKQLMVCLFGMFSPLDWSGAGNVLYLDCDDLLRL